jgi:biopolymer transport protein ExbD
MAGVDVGGGKENISLNIMPMLDVFSILITFLLMSFSTDPVSHDVPAGLELPKSATIKSLDELPAIVVTRTDIMVNDRKIATIVGDDVPEKDRAQGAIYPLFQELEKLAALNKRIRDRARGKAEEAGTKDSGTLTMEMDERHKFKLLKRVLRSAQQAEFVKFKFVVVKDAA